MALDQCWPPFGWTLKQNSANITNIADQSWLKFPSEKSTGQFDLISQVMKLKLNVLIEGNFNLNCPSLEACSKFQGLKFEEFEFCSFHEWEFKIQILQIELHLFWNLSARVILLIQAAWFSSRK